MTLAKTQRLTRDAWIGTGLAALASDGPEALRAEPLARRLGATKGSFYWHFDDLPAYHAALIETWEQAETARITETLAAEETDPSRLRRLAQIIAEDPARDGAAVEPAMRAWALGHAGAQAAVARLDAARLDRLGALLRSVGVGNPEMARIIHAAGLGMAALAPDARGDAPGAIGSLVDLILALR
ncbi:TetR/AcrR family transcriptional regulator [Roseovarius spongiae]|uniref:TetR/AcrR family transcriptional regulator n=1 Tax=Roseovarius spongiae TaxID=2320272 RepID=A0A3A8AT52_9RHOB|nr:TetR/AcrR family transcriptional regulator [Roseovarius spongiae]RKF14694.1 TetR/AcrR family transcriptional regulator [Roseovarius spongiae]